jgi:AraC family transcriptional regulator, transcriptional activator of pobA
MSYVANYSNHVPALTTLNYRDENDKPALPIPFEINALREIDSDNAIQNNCPKQFLQYCILWIKSGTGMIKIDIDQLEMKDNMILCFSPGQVILFNINEPVEGYLISFSAEFLFLSESQTNAAFFENLFDNKKVIYPDIEMQNELTDILRRMKKELGTYCILKAQILKGLLKVFLIYLSRNLVIENQQSLQDRDTEMVKRFTGLVKKNFLTKKMVVDYARDLCVSPNYLNRIVKKISGFTASHHIQQHIILEAKRQAIYSGLSMKEVAYLLGFNDYAHFSKFFKNNSGTNFTCFKNTVQ